LIYIAGVSRGVSVTGVVGLHRPYFASSPQSRQTIEREAPSMLQSGEKLCAGDGSTGRVLPSNGQYRAVKYEIVRA
jgi:hypothetical protein